MTLTTSSTQSLNPPASTSNSTGASGQKPKHKWLPAVAATVGTSLESLDFYLYSLFAALFGGPIFFAGLGSTGAALSSLLTIAVAFVVRPIGALIFGPIGDRIGRRPTLIITIVVMGISTGVIGLLPTYAQIGIWAPIILVLLRIVQGLALAGEWGTAVAMSTEHVSIKKRALAAALPQLGSPIGSLGATALVLTATSTAVQSALGDWAWRVPFLMAFPLMLIALWIRLGVSETPEFVDLQKDKKLVKSPMWQALKGHPKIVLLAVGGALLGIGSYSLMNTYTMTYGSTVLGFTESQLLTATLLGGVLQLVSIPFFGWWATKIGSAKIVAIGSVLTLVISLPMYFTLQTATFGVLLMMMLVGGLLPTMAWAALGGLMHDLFPTELRASGLAISYAVAAMLSGFVPGLTDWFGHATGNAWWHPAVVLMIMSLITAVSAWAAAGWRDGSHLSRGAHK